MYVFISQPCFCYSFVCLPYLIRPHFFKKAWLSGSWPLLSSWLNGWSSRVGSGVATGLAGSGGLVWAAGKCVRVQWLSPWSPCGLMLATPSVCCQGSLLANPSPTDRPALQPTHICIHMQSIRPSAHPIPGPDPHTPPDLTECQLSAVTPYAKP